MRTFLVERYWPGVTRAEATAAEARARRAAEATGDGPEQVRWTRSMLMLEDETVFFLYEAATPELVIAVCERAGVPVDRITECSELDRV